MSSVVKKPRPRVKCPEPDCGKEVADTGLRFHLQLKHGKAANVELPRAGMTGPEFSPGAAAAAGDGAVDESDRELGAPAVDAQATGAAERAAAQALGTDPTPATPPPTAELHVRPATSKDDEHDYERIVDAGLRNVDRALSAAGFPETDPKHMNDVVDAVKPAATYVGRRFGALLIAVFSIAALVAWVSSKVMLRRQQRRAALGGPPLAAPIGGDGTVSRDE